MFRLKEFLLPLCGNSVFGKTVGPFGRRRSGVVAPMTMRRSAVGIVSDRPAAASATVVCRSLNLSNPRKIQAVGLDGLRMSSSLTVKV
jgi:hypothetical protein